MFRMSTRSQHFVAAADPNTGDVKIVSAHMSSHALARRIGNAVIFARGPAATMAHIRRVGRVGRASASDAPHFPEVRSAVGMGAKLAAIYARAEQFEALP